MECPKVPIKCSVQNCHYNNNAQCHASALEINAVGDYQPETSVETSCTTFKPDESNYT